MLWYDTWDGLIHSPGHFLLTYCKRRQTLWWVPFIAMTPTFAAFLISPCCLEENGAIPLWCCIRSFKDQSPRMVELDSPTSSLPECSRSNMPVLQDQELTFFGIVAHLTFQTWDVTLPQAGWSQDYPTHRRVLHLGGFEDHSFWVFGEVAVGPLICIQFILMSVWGKWFSRAWKPFLHLHMPNNTHDTFPQPHPCIYI